MATNGPTREEIDAKLALAEARTETYFVRLESKLDRVADAVAEVKADNKNTRSVIVLTVISAVLAAIAALWVTQANLLSAIQLNLAAHPVAANAVH